MKLYGIKTCDSCRKARKALPAANFIDIREAPLSDDVLTRALAAFGADLINRKSTTWRALDAAARGADAKTLLRAHPTLMKRPLIDDGTRMTIGWTAEAQEAWA